jgi:hypothetical protein
LVELVTGECLSWTRCAVRFRLRASGRRYPAQENYRLKLIRRMNECRL